MPDWTKSMTQTYEYYIVDPATWGNDQPLDCVTDCAIDRDIDSATLGSAKIGCTEELDECYVRAYLITLQNGVKESHPLGTFLVQTPSDDFDGKNHSVSLDAYTPLLELKEKKPPLGYAIRNGEKIMDIGYRLCRENMRAPVVKTESPVTLTGDFVSSTEDDWLTFLDDLIANAQFAFSLDDMGRVLFAPEQDTASLQPVFTYNDDNSSILYPDISVERDLYNVPNVVEVLYSTAAGFFYAKAVNDDENSAISTVRRGREIIHRITDPDLAGKPSQIQVNDYAKQVLRNLSCLEYSLTYTHGYNGVRIGDCVRLNYERAGLRNVKARVKRQSIKCESGCPVTETATFNVNLWKR